VAVWVPTRVEGFVVLEVKVVIFISSRVLLDFGLKGV